MIPDRFEELVREQAEPERYTDSDSVALFEDSPGMVRLEPVVLKEGEAYVQIEGAFYQPEQLAHFLRIEPKPSARPRPAPLPRANYTAETHAVNITYQEDPLARLAREQERWALEKK